MNRTSWIPAHRQEELRSLVQRSRQVVLLAALTGAITGLIVAGFEALAAEVLFDRVLEMSPWVAAWLPGLGLLVGLAIRKWIGRGVSPSTTDEYLHAFHDPHHRLGLRALIARMLAAVATIGSGVPMGMEGPSLYAGATLGGEIQKRLPGTFRAADRRLLMTAGAAAGVAAIFKAPATGAVFALEVPYQDDLARRMLLPAMVASATGYLSFVAIHGTTALFPVEGISGFVAKDLAGAAVLGIIGGLSARAFGKMIRDSKSISAGGRSWSLTLVAGLVIAGMFGLGRLLTGESLVLGSGYDVLAWAAEPDRGVWLLLAMLAIRSIGTSAAVAGGGTGGLFIPLVVAGALIGSMVGRAVNHTDLTLFIVIGVSAFLGAGYRVPLAAVMFVAETTGRPSFIVPGLIAAVAAELVMGQSSVTTYQRSTIMTRGADDGPR